MQHDLGWLLTDYGDFLQKFGLVEAEIRAHYAEWKTRSGRNDAKDYLWYLFQVIAGETAKQVNNPADLHKNNLEIYGAMWFFRTHVEGQRANDLRQLLNETRICLWRLELPFTFRVRLLSAQCCAYCDAMNETLFLPEDLLRQQGFSATACTNEAGCACTLAPVAESDEDGKILLKQPAAN